MTFDFLHNSVASPPLVFDLVPYRILIVVLNHGSNLLKLVISRGRLLDWVHHIVLHLLLDVGEELAVEHDLDTWLSLLALHFLDGHEEPNGRHAAGERRFSYFSGKKITGSALWAKAISQRKSIGASFARSKAGIR
jgi:hypothetical protein